MTEVCLHALMTLEDRASSTRLGNPIVSIQDNLRLRTEYKAEEAISVVAKPWVDQRRRSSTSGSRLHSESSWPSEQCRMRITSSRDMPSRKYSLPTVKGLQGAMAGTCERGRVRAPPQLSQGLPITQDTPNSKPCRGGTASVSDRECR
jgi:hypothetical protein